MRVDVKGGDLPGLKSLMARMADANRSVLVGIPAGEFEEGTHQRGAKEQARFVSSRTRVAVRRAKARARAEFMATDEELEEGPLRSIFRKNLRGSVAAATKAASKSISPTAGSGNIPLAMIAAVHEFGQPEKNIPERSFLRGGIRRGRPKFHRLNVANLRLVLLDKKTIDESIELLGVVAAGEVKREFTAGSFQALSPKTIERKGSSRPLIDTGQLRQSITYVIEGKQSARARVVR